MRNKKHTHKRKSINNSKVKLNNDKINWAEIKKERSNYNAKRQKEK